MKNDFLILHRILARMWECAGDEGGRGGRREGGGINELN